MNLKNGMMFQGEWNLYRFLEFTELHHLKLYY
jgi:hypothetical protein